MFGVSTHRLGVPEVIGAPGSGGSDLASVIGQERMYLMFRALKAELVEPHMRCVGQELTTHKCRLSQEWMYLREGEGL